ncbi:MAG: ribonuclease III [Candidatus Liptonbacteria bacterium]|nr:ribonuclease III [Candidatus Liptonbacteria bacterium]
MQALNSFYQIIGINFKNPDLIQEALTHRSYLNENTAWSIPHNERLEYLGDAVLELAVSEFLFAKFATYPEGQLTVLRASLVNYQLLARVANQIQLGEYLHMSRGEAKDTGRAREVILANAIEAVIGAIYLDQGYTVAQGFVERFVQPHLGEILKTRSYKDPKSELQEIIQERLRVTPTYNVLSEEGPAHQRIFTVGVYFGNQLIAQGGGPSKQEAETEAAKNALQQNQR